MASLKPAFEPVPSAEIPPSEQAASMAPAIHSVVVSDTTPPASPNPQSFTSPSKNRPIITRASRSYTASPPKPPGSLYPPATSKGIDADGLAEDWDKSFGEAGMVLELADGLSLAGHSFGAKKSVAGECVFQTGW